MPCSSSFILWEKVALSFLSLLAIINSDKLMQFWNDGWFTLRDKRANERMQHRWFKLRRVWIEISVQRGWNFCMCRALLEQRSWWMHVLLARVSENFGGWRHYGVWLVSEISEFFQWSDFSSAFSVGGGPGDKILCVWVLRDSGGYLRRHMWFQRIRDNADTW